MEVSTDPTTETMNMYSYVNNIFMNPVVYIILLLVLVVYFILFYSLGNKGSSNPSSGNGNTEPRNWGTIFVIILVCILLIINGLTYFLGINLVSYISGLFNGTPTVNIIVDQNDAPVKPPVPEIRFIEEVFNIPGNYYTYNDSKAICNAYGAKLASYDQLEKAYNKGAEWCNYGWSDGQMVLYPTQQSTYDKLQNAKGHEHDCGRPGINGGFIANPDVKFGINCYGHKPKITDEEKELMENSILYPPSREDVIIQKKTDYWRDHVDEILVSPFNHNSWSRI